MSGDRRGTDASQREVLEIEASRLGCPVYGMVCPRHASMPRHWRQSGHLPSDPGGCGSAGESLVINWLQEESISAVDSLFGLRWDGVDRIGRTAVWRALKRQCRNARPSRRRETSSGGPRTRRGQPPAPSSLASSEPRRGGDSSRSTSNLSTFHGPSSSSLRGGVSSLPGPTGELPGFRKDKPSSTHPDFPWGPTSRGPTAGNLQWTDPRLSRIAPSYLKMAAVCILDERERRGVPAF